MAFSVGMGLTNECNLCCAHYYFPKGVYQVGVDTPGSSINPRDWHFLVADQQCNTSDTLSYPHEPRSQQVIR